MDSEDMVAVFSTSNPSQIAMAKSILIGEKIYFFAQGEIHSAMETCLPVRFLVPKQEAERAKVALNRMADP